MPNDKTITRSESPSRWRVAAPETETHRTHYLLFGLALVFMLATLGLLYANPGSGGSRHVAIGLLLLGVGLVAARIMALPMKLGAALRGAYLGPWLGVGFAVGYGFGTIRQSTDSASLPVTLDADFILLGALVSCVGFVAAVVTYRITTRPLVLPIARFLDNLRGSRAMDYSARAAWGLLALGMLGYLGAYASGRFGYLGDARGALSETSSLPYFSGLLTDLGLLAVVLAGWRWSRNRTWSALLQLGLMMSLLLVVALLLGMKQGPWEVLGAAGIGVLSNARARSLWWVGVMIAAVVIVTPFMNQYREIANQGEGNRAGLGEVAQLLVPSKFVEVLLESNIQDTSEQLAKRSSRPSEVGIIVQYTPQTVPYAPISEVVFSPLIGLVPRSLWPEKPVLADGIQLQGDYYGTTGSYSSVGVPPYADLYRHGGMLVMIFGMGVYGFVLRIVDTRLRSVARDPTQLFLPFLLIVVVIKQENPFTGFMASLVGVILVSVVATRLATALSSRGVSTPQPLPTTSRTAT